MYKYPELLLLIGQHTSNITQRIAYYTGYFQHFEMTMQNYPNVPDLSVETVQLKGNMFPVKSLIKTPLPRLIITVVLKSLITHNGTFASWPQSYTYQPAKSQVKTCVIKDVLISTCALQEIKDFMQKCLRNIVQQLFNEKTFDLFKILCIGGSDGQTYLRPLVKIIFQRLILALGHVGVPDCVKTIFTCARFTIDNFVRNVCKFFSQDQQSHLARALKERYPEWL